MLCERTDNEASGSTEALSITIIKYNLKKHKNNGKYSNTKNKVKNTIIYSQILSDFLWRGSPLNKKSIRPQQHLTKESSKLE